MREAAALALGALLAACATPEQRSREDAIVATARATSPPPLPDDDPDAAVAREEAARLERLAWEEVVRSVSPARRVSGEALVRLLPGYRFLLLAWEDRPADPERKVSIAYGLYQIVAIAPDGSRTRHFAYGNHEPFGEMLEQARVRVATEEDARLVWSAYCELFGKPRDRRYERASATSWRLGISDTGDRRYWYEVTVDGSGNVTSGCLRSARLAELRATGG